MTDLESRYLQKLDNEVSEHLFDLLIMHLLEAEDKIKTKQKELVEILDRALEFLEQKTTEYNRLYHYRYMLIICNKILRYRTQREDIKERKKKIIQDFIHSEGQAPELIPLTYQINEVRLTYDTQYLRFLVTKLINQKQWGKALYCLIAAQLIEPDNTELDELEKKINEHIPQIEIEQSKSSTPKDMTLALDANVVISHICYDAEGYQIPKHDTFNLELLGNTNKFIITPSVKEEVRNHLDYMFVGIKRKCEKIKYLRFIDVKNALNKRFDKIIKKYGVECTYSEQDLTKVKNFYNHYLSVLKEITLRKINHKIISHKLRKLAQREGLLPEQGDLKLLAELMSMDKPIGILSNDNDFIFLETEIIRNFGIKVYY